MHVRRSARGFTLIELLLVLFIIGVISAIATPVFLGQRRRSKAIGDAIAGAKIIAMEMETFRADNGRYGPANASATWTYNTDPAVHNTPALTGFTQNPCPNFRPGGNSKMTYTLTVTGPATFNLTVNATEYGGIVAYRTNETGAQLERM